MRRDARRLAPADAARAFRPLTPKELRDNATRFRLMAKFFPDKSERLIQSAENFEWLARMKDRRAGKEQELSSSSGWQRHHPNQTGRDQDAEARQAEQRQPSRLEGNEEAIPRLERCTVEEQRLDRTAALIASVIWGAGFAVLWWLWHNRIFVHEFMEGVVLLWVSMFYVLAWFPIRDHVRERLVHRAAAKKS